MIDTRKIKNLGGFFIIGLACLGFGLWQIISISTDNETKFRLINGHVTHLEYTTYRFKGSVNHSIELKLSEYPLFTFHSDNQTLLDNRQKLFNNISIAKFNKSGDLINILIDTDDAKYIDIGDINKYSIGKLILNDHIRFYALSDTSTKYLEYNANAEINSGKKKTFLVFTFLGLLCILTGVYKWRKKYGSH